MRYTVLLIIHFGFTALVAQSGSISGQILSPDNLGLTDAQIEIVELNRSRYSRANGNFVLENVPAGSYTLRITYVGFRTQVIGNITVAPGKTTAVQPLKMVVDPQLLDAAVVTATRTEKSVIDVANAVNVIGELAIRERNAKTSAEALREETGVFVQKTNHGGGSAIIRGLSSNQVLLMVDGVRLNNSTYRLGNHQYLTTVDYNALSKIEVVRGPASVLHGSDALGGTINLITRRPPTAADNRVWGATTRLYTRHATADDEILARGELAVFNHKFAMMMGYSHKDFGDLRRGGNSDHPQLEQSTNGLLQSPTGFTARDLDAKLFYELTPAQNLLFAYQLSRQEDVPRYDKYESGDNVRWLYDPQKRDLAYLRYHNELNHLLIRNLQATVSFHRQVEGRVTQKRVDSDIERELDAVNTIGFSLQANANFNRHVLTYGAELYHDNVDSRAETENIQTGALTPADRGRFPDGATYRSFGAYAQDEIYFSPKWIGSAGLRYSRFDAGFSVSDAGANSVNFSEVDQNFQSLTGSFSLIYKATPHFSVNTTLGQAFRAPNLSDLSKLGESKGSTFEVPNDNLSPEKMLSGDLSLRWHSERLNLNATGFYAAISDLLASADAFYNGLPYIIRSGDTLKVKHKENIGEGYITGLEFAGQWQFHPSFRLSGNLAYTYGQNTTADEPIGGVPPLFGMAGIHWQSGRFHSDIYTRFAARQDRLSADDLDDPRIPAGGTPGWHTWNVRFSATVLPNFDAQIGLENFFDVNYREHGSGVNGPGRNVIFSLYFTR